MLLRNTSKKQASLSLSVNGKQTEEAKTMSFLGKTKTPRLNCNDIKTRANKRNVQLWRLSNLNVDQDNLLLLEKSLIRLLVIYANAFRPNQSKTIISNMQKTHNRALKICFRKHQWYNMQKLNEELNAPNIRKLQVRQIRDYIKRAK